MVVARADSAGFVPVERLELIEPLDDGSWWQRTAHNHLFDFSDTDRTQNLIVVDPVVQAYVGQSGPRMPKATLNHAPGGTTSVGRVFKASSTASGTWEASC